jgi:heme oxygenase
VQALNWLETDLTVLTALPGGDHPRVEVDLSPPARLEAQVVAEQVDQRFRELLSAPSSSWGVAYVLRGSRLGGAVLAPLVSDATGLPAGTGTAYLRSAGDEPGRDWVDFRRRLDVLDLSFEQIDLASDAARWTFARVGSELAAGRQRHERSR